ncbi:MAG: zf-TFIIB domain-containing protein [Leucobacter sp.]
MNCPSDGTTLLMSERQGVEVDYCPQCRGIWLDRGELDKILERMQADTVAEPAPQFSEPRREQPRYDDRDQPRYDDRGRNGHHDDRQRDGHYDDRRRDPRYRKKKSPFEFLGDIFEG